MILIFVDFIFIDPPPDILAEALPDPDRHKKKKKLKRLITRPQGDFKPLPPSTTNFEPTLANSCDSPIDDVPGSPDPYEDVDFERMRGDPGYEDIEYDDEYDSFGAQLPHILTPIPEETSEMLEQFEHACAANQSQSPPKYSFSFDSNLNVKAFHKNLPSPTDEDDHVYESVVYRPKVAPPSRRVNSWGELSNNRNLIGAKWKRAASADLHLDLSVIGQTQDDIDIEIESPRTHEESYLDNLDSDGYLKPRSSLPSLLDEDNYEPICSHDKSSPKPNPYTKLLHTRERQKQEEEDDFRNNEEEDPLYEIYGY